MKLFKHTFLFIFIGTASIVGLLLYKNLPHAPSTTSLNATTTLSNQAAAPAPESSAGATKSTTADVPIDQQLIAFSKRFFNTSIEPKIERIRDLNDAATLTFPEIGSLSVQNNLNLAYFSITSNKKPCPAAYREENKDNNLTPQYSEFTGIDWSQGNCFKTTSGVVNVVNGNIITSFRASNYSDKIQHTVQPFILAVNAEANSKYNLIDPGFILTQYTTAYEGPGRTTIVPIPDRKNGLVSQTAKTLSGSYSGIEPSQIIINEVRDTVALIEDSQGYAPLHIFIAAYKEDSVDFLTFFKGLEPIKTADEGNEVLQNYIKNIEVKDGVILFKIEGSSVQEYNGQYQYSFLNKSLVKL